MRRLSLEIFKAVSCFLYPILGPSLSTKIATSALGKMLVKLLYGNSRGLKIHTASNGIRLKLTQEEALIMGMAHLGLINLYETEVLSKIIKKGDIFIDVGAYIDGWYSLLAAKKIGPKGHVFAFEPNPSCYRRLKENIKLNNLDNVTLEKIALSQKKRF